jgi:hypothetical protein
MSFESLMTECQTLKSSMEALAAIGAELRLRRGKLGGDSRVRPLLQEVVHHIDPELLDHLDANQEEAALALIQTSFRQAIDLLENPAHAPGWSYEDPVVLESQGQVSRMIVRGIDMLAAQRPDISATLRQPGAFLDVGTGVGWLAIGRLAHIRAQSTPAQCAGQSTHEFADRTRGWSSMDDKGGGGTARRVRLRAGRGILTLASHYVGARSAPDPTHAFGVKPLGPGRADQSRNRFREMVVQSGLVARLRSCSVP